MSVSDFNLHNNLGVTARAAAAHARTSGPNCNLSDTGGSDTFGAMINLLKPDMLPNGATEPTKSGNADSSKTAGDVVGSVQGRRLASDQESETLCSFFDPALQFSMRSASTDDQKTSINSPGDNVIQHERNGRPSSAPFDDASTQFGKLPPQNAAPTRISRKTSEVIRPAGHESRSETLKAIPADNSKERIPAAGARHPTSHGNENPMKISVTQATARLRNSDSLDCQNSTLLNREMSKTITSGSLPASAVLEALGLLDAGSGSPDSENNLAPSAGQISSASNVSYYTDARDEKYLTPIRTLEIQMDHLSLGSIAVSFNLRGNDLDIRIATERNETSAMILSRRTQLVDRLTTSETTVTSLIVQHASTQFEAMNEQTSAGGCQTPALVSSDKSGSNSASDWTRGNGGPFSGGAALETDVEGEHGTNDRHYVVV